MGSWLERLDVIPEGKSYPDTLTPLSSFKLEKVANETTCLALDSYIAQIVFKTYFRCAVNDYEKAHKTALRLLLHNIYGDVKGECLSILTHTYAGDREGILKAVHKILDIIEGKPYV